MKLPTILSKWNSMGFAVALSAALVSGMPAKADPSISYQLETIAEGLGFPWNLAFLPDGSILVTELDGRLRVIRDGVLDPVSIAGVPDVLRKGHGGLLDVMLHPDFTTNRLVYLSYAHGNDEANTLRVSRAVFDGSALSDLEIIFDAMPLTEMAVHFGGRMAFDLHGKLFITMGDAFNYREEAQNLANTLGAIVRLNDDGSVPTDNPFVGEEGINPEIFSYGHRNPQGIVIADTGAVFSSEHGAQGGDEINLIEAGKNYGWPVITHGIDYSGARISPFTQMEGMEQPLKYWVPSIAPANLELYTGELFAAWQGDFLVAGLVPGDVRRVDMEGGVVVGEEILFTEIGARIRDIQMAPDGSLYILTDSEAGIVVRATPN